MKSRHMAAMQSSNHRLLWRFAWIATLILIAFAGAAFAQDEADPPARAALLSYRQGSLVFAPQGEDEWTELPANRPLTAGDRVWTDRGARAELQLGAATLHVDAESHLGLNDLDERTAHFILQQGSVNVRVRELVQGENVEVDTPNLAFRALRPGDYRVDVDPLTAETRVSVASGLAAVFGENGESIHLGPNQQANFAGRALARVPGPAVHQDDFALWAAERNRLEDQSVAARYVPRGVVGYAQLDAHGSWNHDPNYGAVWYPAVAMPNWAPYRYGHWSWIAPWGWTWVDDAPWGFAPFHYGRWTMIGTRWAWVPGRLAPRPVYAPALVVFLGGGGSRLAVHSGPAVGWYPLAPGEAWWPVFRTSHRYVNHANAHINLNAWPRHHHNHLWRSRPVAVTAVAEDDFRRGRPVHRHWQPVPPHMIGQALTNVVPVRPEPRQRSGPRVQHTPPANAARPFAGQHQHRGVQPPGPAASVIQPGIPPSADQPAAVPPAMAPRFFGGRDAPAVREQFRAQREQERQQRDAAQDVREQIRAQREQERLQRDAAQDVREQFRAQREQERLQRDAAPAVREQFRAQREQERLQRDAERAAREQQRMAQEQARQQQDLRGQRELQMRQQQEQAARLQQDHSARMQREAAQRQAHEHAMQQRAQQEHALRQQQAARAQQEQAMRLQQDRTQREALRQQQHVPAPPQHVRVPQQQVQPVQQPQAAPAAPAARGHGGGHPGGGHRGQRDPDGHGRGGGGGGGGRGGPGPR
jgi:hypothetical protein